MHSCSFDRSVSFLNDYLDNLFIVRLKGPRKAWRQAGKSRPIPTIHFWYESSAELSRHYLQYWLLSSGYPKNLFQVARSNCFSAPQSPSVHRNIWAIFLFEALLIKNPNSVMATIRQLWTFDKRMKVTFQVEV